jgi:dipeptidase E
MAQSVIVALGGGGFSEEPDNSLLDDYILALTSKPNPRVCFVPTASGDAAPYIVKFYSAFNRKDCRPSHLALLQDSPRDLEAFVLEQDILYVGGGNTVTMLASWKAMGLDVLLRRAWAEGTLLCGLSAGSICWFEGGPTDSFQDGKLHPITNGLGILSGSHCPHYESEELRRPEYQRMIHQELLPPGYAADDGVGLVFEGTALKEAVSSREGAKAWRVEPSPQGVLEIPVQTRYLG